LRLAGKQQAKWVVVVMGKKQRDLAAEEQFKFPLKI